MSDQDVIRILELGEYEIEVNKRLERWNEISFPRRLWEKDATLWFPKPVPEITNRLGWLFLPEIMLEQVDDLEAFADEIRSEGFKHVVLLGMGGSSLAPEVFQSIFGNKEGYPALLILDSTHPSAIRAIEDRISLESTLFLVSSKSGTTIETLSLFRYFWKQVGQIDEDRDRHFVAITDPGTPLAELARERGFRKIFESSKAAHVDVGGRYSALTFFGLVPASLIGMDVHKFLDQSRTMSENCAFCVPSDETSGLVLAAALGELAQRKRDKVTFLTSSSVESFPVWLEQLIAESTGKDGKGIVPIVNEPLTSLKNYGDDRFFIYFSVETDENTELEELVKELVTEGHPMIRIVLSDKINVGQEIYCWEVAVAAAGTILGIHPFDQPNVQMAKDLARKMMNRTEKETLSTEDVETVTTEKPEKLKETIRTWLTQARKGDYIAIQAYLAQTTETTETLQKIRLELVKRLHLATTLGYGPRFLHSTGQLHKGGPNTGLFIQLIDAPTENVPVPETNYIFSELIKAQALGDYKALKQLGRRVLRINLGKDTKGNLLILSKLIAGLGGR
jgi:transaldolase/glucose-6-phosphate isomerase